MENNIDKDPFDILSEGIKLVRDRNDGKNPSIVSITSKELIDAINQGIEKLETNTGIVPDTIIVPKSMIDRLVDVQNKQLQIDIWRQQGKTVTGEPWKGNREYRRKNKVK